VEEGRRKRQAMVSLENRNGHGDGAAGGPVAAAVKVERPDPEVPEKARRRQFSAAYKLRIVREADACGQDGELGALLRREGLYSSHLASWRRQRDEGSLACQFTADNRPWLHGRSGPGETLRLGGTPSAVLMILLSTAVVDG